VFRIELQDRLASHWALCAEQKPRKKRQAELESAKAASAEFVAMSNKLATLLCEDEMGSFDACTALQEVVDSRLAMEQEASAERFLRSIVHISEQRLEVARDDVDARGFLAESWSAIADLQVAADDLNPEEVMASYRKSLEQYKTLRPSSWFDEIDFENYIDTALSAAEFAADFDLPESDALFKEARQLLSEAIAANFNLDPDWLNDTQQRLEKP
jgi:hypothetical protein